MPTFAGNTFFHNKGIRPAPFLVRQFSSLEHHSLMRIRALREVSRAATVREWCSDGLYVAPSGSGREFCKSLESISHQETMRNN